MNGYGLNHAQGPVAEEYPSCPEMRPVLTLDAYPWFEDCYPALKRFDAHLTAGGCYIERYELKDGSRGTASGQTVETFREGLDELSVPRGIEDAFELGTSCGLMIALKTLGPELLALRAEVRALKGLKGVA